MSSPTALFARILAEPGDDAVRREFADALGSGSPRAEFIKLQLAIARGAASAGDRRRHGELFREHGVEWAGWIAKVADSYLFRTGFIEHLEMKAAKFVEYAWRLFEAAPIRDVRLTGVLSAPEVLDSAHFGRLRSLNLMRQNLNDEAAARLAASPGIRGLRWLSLANNRIGMDGLLALLRSPNLRDLHHLDFDSNLVESPVGRMLEDDRGGVYGEQIPELGKRLQAEHPEVRWLKNSYRPSPQEL